MARNSCFSSTLKLLLTIVKTKLRKSKIRAAFKKKMAEIENRIRKQIKYSPREVRTLIALVTERKDIIESTRTDALSVKERDAAWDAIATSFARICGSRLPIKLLKSKNTELRRQVRQGILENEAISQLMLIRAEKNQQFMAIAEQGLCQDDHLKPMDGIIEYDGESCNIDMLHQMDAANRIRRQLDYTPREEMALISLVTDRKDIIPIIDDESSGKQTGAAWDAIAATFAKMSGIWRPGQLLKIKYDYLKRNEKHVIFENESISQLITQAEERKQMNDLNPGSSGEKCNSDEEELLRPLTMDNIIEYDGDTSHQIEAESPRKRSLNYTAEEEMALISLVMEKKDIIETTRADAVAWKQKDAAWEEIAEFFAKKTGFRRPGKLLKSKYDNMKTLVKQGMLENETISRILLSKAEKIKQLMAEKSLAQGGEKCDSDEDHIIEYNEESGNDDKSTQIQEEKLKLIKAQRTFYEQENLRAQEKHMEEMEILSAKRELLYLEIAEKKRKLDE